MNGLARALWEPTLARLLDPEQPTGGAELAVTDIDGELVLRAPLARHFRVDAAATSVWIRPIAGGYVAHARGPGEPSYRYSLNVARRRALPFHVLSCRDDELVFALADGGRALVRPIRADLRDELERWDAFVGLLPADVEQSLDDLLDDSWHGQWA